MQAIKKYKSNQVKLAFFLVIVAAIFGILFSLPRLLIPFGIAYIFALMLHPIKRLFYSVSFKKKTLAFAFIVATGFVFIYPVVHGINTATEEAHKIEYYLPRLENYLREKYKSARVEIKERFNYEIELNPVDKVVEYGQASTKAVLVYLPWILTSLIEWGFVIPLFLFFILKDGRKLRFNFLKLVPNNIVERAYYLFFQFNKKFGDYIFAKFIEAALVGTIITTGLVIIGFPFAFLLGILAAVTNIVPYIGPFVGFLPALVIGLADQNPNTTLSAMVILYLVANIIDLALVFPLLVSKIVNLHPLLVVVSVILGSQFGGVIGMIISIPLAAFIKLLSQEIYKEIYSTR